MEYWTRVLTKNDKFPPFDELVDLIFGEHPEYRLSIEEGTEDEWETLLLARSDGVGVALIERLPVFEGSIGEDEIADFLEDTQNCSLIHG